MATNNVLLETLYRNPYFENMTLKRVNATCPTHGRYETFSRTNPDGTEYIGRCPECQRIELIKQQESCRISSSDSNIVSDRLLAAGVPEEYAGLTFETLPPGLLANGDLISSCIELCDKKISNLVMLGTTGVGKTSLSCATLARILQNREGDYWPSICYTTEARLLRAMKSTFGRREGPTEQDIINQMGRYDVLVIDEIGKAPASDYNVAALEEIINIRYRTRRTVICGNISGKELQTHFSEGMSSKLAYNSQMKDIRDRDHRRDR